MSPKARRPKVTRGLPPVRLRKGENNTYFARAKALWDELHRFEAMLRTTELLDREAPRFSRSVTAINALIGLLECQNPQTASLVLPAAARQARRK
jgi:hypothetical protein